MPKGAFSISYKSGLRAILVNVPNNQGTRRYLGIPVDVPFYLKDAWSFCSPPTKIDAKQITDFMKLRDWPGQKFEAICKIKVDGDDVVRGLIISVPRL